MSDETPKLGSRSSRALSDMSRRIQEIVDAAERAALEIQDEAEEEARKIIDAARSEAERIAGDRESALGEISDAARSGAERLAEQARSLAAEIERATGRLREQGAAPVSSSGSEPDSPDDDDGAGGPFPAAVAYPGTRAAQAAESAEPAPGAAKPTEPVGEEPLLRATQMAVAGASRADIEEALRTEFGVEDPAAVADEILGAEAS